MEILAGFAFDGDGPYLMIDRWSEGTTKREIYYCRDQVFSIVRCRARYCVGYYNLETLESFPCPDQTKLTLEEKQSSCVACTKRNGFNPGFYNAGGNISQQQLKYNAQPHVVYLANFGKGVSKVGIASEARSRIRLLEQGARTANIIARCENADQARFIEASIHKTVKLPEVVSNKNKRLLVNQEYSFEEGREEIERIKLNLKEQLGFREAGISAPECLDMLYFGNNQLKLPITDLSGQAPLEIGGKCVGMVGDLLLMENEGMELMVSLKQIVSHVIKFEEGEKAKLRERKGQLNLF